MAGKPTGNGRLTHLGLTLNPLKTTFKPIMHRYILACIFLLSAIVSSAKDEFTQLEQQQISVETPGLFSQSNAFQVDFSHMPKTDYSFPLPVGKATAVTATAVEIETKPGDAVKAMFGGKVRLSKSIASFGNVIVIRHDNGLETVYSHNAQNLVKVGQTVKAGQTIAIVGHEGNRAFCSFSIMVNGRWINPETIIDTKGHALRKQTVTFKKVGSNIDISTSRVKAKEKEQEGMSMETNDPFGGNSVYRLDLTAIKSWHYPLDDSHVISDYGGKRNHSGVDIKNAPNKEVYAVFDGVVVQSGVFSGYGKCITLRHANGLETRYSHNSKNYVNVGEKVKAGQVIGTTGRTGRATTEHLHFETRINGRAFNPAYVLDHKNHCLQKCTLQFKKNGGVTRLK